MPLLQGGLEIFERVAFHDWDDLEDSIRRGRQTETSYHAAEDPQTARELLVGLRAFARVGGERVVSKLDLPAGATRMLDLGSIGNKSCESAQRPGMSLMSNPSGDPEAGDRDLIITGDDDSLLAGIGVDGKIIHTPGHTHDSISVILSDGSAIVGDAAMNFMEFCRTRHRPIYIQDLEQTFQSWEKLREHGAQVVYPSHGDPFAADELVAAG